VYKHLLNGTVGDAKKKGGERLDCPKCGKKMTKLKNDVYACQNQSCDDPYIAYPMSGIGIHK